METLQGEKFSQVRQAAEKVFNYLNIKDEPKAADVIFILGGSSLEPINRAAQLYKEGFAPKIAFVSQGGKFGGEAVWGMTEVEKYKQVLLELGVSESDIVCEEDRSKQTRNTFDEARYAIPFLNECGFNLQKMILVSRPVHQRRAYLTFLQIHPEIGYINCPAHERLDVNDPKILARQVQEMERLLDYGVKEESISKPSITIDVLRASVILRKYLKQIGLYQSRTKPKAKFI
ncbi:hypothetical protein COV89_00025 [Candidatus Shapirobacteria bacterium CG11_big_fil_rev_8_21_14_0_20_40_12]|uniref:DUF218 domain-containing protein n=1 Tax=Candidatus Shapirobacteria bacterium CG11_big_fil_rev_8_21_14_0_20_40_12 TaxID=1974889 RepID=A0A2H0KGY1_9BACT|nr:MAG: hypothetical protein COV89_00025 [Candidatus Shapirobacteria bacterium CG11_big_fil_rev_8_21_14_0_20_40_12]